MLDDVKDILCKVSHDGDDKYEKVSDDAKDILKKVYNDGEDIFDIFEKYSDDDKDREILEEVFNDRDRLKFVSRVFYVSFKGV